MHEPTELLMAAREAAAACAEYLARAFRQPKGAYREKGPGDLVSEVDEQSQQLARSLLLTRTPEAAFLAEEGEAALGAEQIGDRLVWIVDPLDGTANFLHRFPMFSISIAAARGTEVLAAAVTNPVTGERFEAARGRGATLNGHPIRVSDEPRLSHALLATGWPFRRLDLLEPYLAVFENLFRGSQDMRRPGAASLDLAYTAAGRLDGYWEFNLKIWDLAAGVLLVREAGGQVSDFAGREQGWPSGNIVATNGRIHEALLRAAASPEGLEKRRS